MITVLLSTYNGEKYLREQLDSLVGQSEAVNILVRDDGSNDNTLAILEEYQRGEKLKFIRGSNLGVAKSFINLLENAPESEYYAFCDQDDVWDETKIEAAIEKLSLKDNSIPLLYMSTTRVVDAELKPLKNKKAKSKLITFGLSLIESVAVGCTYVFNSALTNLFKQYKPEGYFMHDWFVHKVAAACGEVIFDEIPHISYRQHGANVIGEKVSIKKRVKNILLGKSKGVRYRDALVIEKYFVEKLKCDERKIILNDLICYKNGFKAKWRLIFHKAIRPTQFFDRLFFRFLVFFERL